MVTLPKLQTGSSAQARNPSQCEKLSFVTTKACDCCQVVSQISSGSYDKAPSRNSNTGEVAKFLLPEELPSTAPLELLLKDGLGEGDVDQPCARTYSEPAVPSKRHVVQDRTPGPV